MACKLCLLSIAVSMGFKEDSILLFAKSRSAEAQHLARHRMRREVQHAKMFPCLLVQG